MQYVLVPLKSPALAVLLNKTGRTTTFHQCVATFRRISCCSSFQVQCM